MPEHMTRLFEVSLGCGILIVLLLLLTPALSKRFSPKVRYCAWFLLAVRLVCFGWSRPLPKAVAPIQMNAPVSLTAPVYDPNMSKDLEKARPYGYQGSVAGSRMYELWYYDDQNNEFHIYDNPIFRLEGVNGSWDFSIHWEGLWAAGVLVSLLWFGLGYARLCRETKKRRLSASEEARQALEEQSAALGITRAVGLWSVPGLCSPMLMGFFRPAVLLPEHLPAEALPVTLAHELTHLKRRDLWYKGFLTAVCCAHWFNPLVWLMLRQAGRDVELCCDYDLLQNQDEEARRAYGQAILDQMTAADRAASPLTTGFSGDKKSVFTRFRAIMDTTAKKKGTALVVLAMLATALAGGLVACNTAQTEEGGVSAWLESQEDISIDTNSLLLYIDEKDGSLPTLTMRGDEDVLVLQLPQGVTRTVRVDEEQSYDSTFFSTFYELEPDENFRVTLPITRRSDGSYGETAVYTFVWGKRDASSFTFRVVMPLDTGNTWESLEFADVIDSYNNTPDFPHDLGASVVQYEGRPCYQFENAQVGVAARTFPDPAEPENWIAEITYGSRSSTFQLGHLFPLASWKYGHVAGEAEFYLRDLTGDGVPEFLFLWGYHQSGMGLDECKIIELTQMQELTVETPPGAMAEAIQIRPVDVCKRQNDPNHNLGYVVYEVTGPDGTKHLCQTIAQRKPVEEYSSELDFRSNVSLHLDGNQLLLSACFVPNDSSMSPGISRLGQLTCQLTYDPKDSIFRIQPPFTMELFDPVDAS